MWKCEVAEIFSRSTPGVQDGMNVLDLRCTPGVQRFQETPAKVTQAVKQVGSRAKDSAVWAMDGVGCSRLHHGAIVDEDAKVAFAGSVGTWHQSPGFAEVWTIGTLLLQLAEARATGTHLILLDCMSAVSFAQKEKRCQDRLGMWQKIWDLRVACRKQGVVVCFEHVPAHGRHNYWKRERAMLERRLAEQ